MLIIDSIRKINNSQINIPPYHRGPLSLTNETSVTSCYLPNNKTSNNNIREIVVSPYDFNDWDKLIRIGVRFNDKQGIYSKLTKIIESQDLEILSGESSTIRNRSVHSIELVVAERNYKQSLNKLNEISDEDFLNSLERRIIALLDISELPHRNKYPRIRIRRIKGLYFAKREYQELLNNSNLLEKPIVCISQIKKGKYIIPPEINNIIQISVDRAQILTNTKERLLRVFLPTSNENYSFLRIEFLKGAKAQQIITTELSLYFNILMSFVRNGKNNNQFFECLLHSEKLNKHEEENLRRSIIESIFSKTEYLGYNFKIAFPKSVNSEIVTHSPTFQLESNEYQTENKLSNLQLEKSTSFLLQQKIKSLRKTITSNESNDFLNEVYFRDKIQVFKSLLKDETGGSELNPTLFISYPFEKEDYIDFVKKTITEDKYLIITGEKPLQKPAFRDVIIQRIKDADMFLGIWANEENSGKLSSWLLWELGIAMAFNKPFRIILKDGANSDSLKRIVPEKHYESFKETNFEEKLKDIFYKGLLPEFEEQNNWV